MGQYIVKLENRYLIWSTIVDAPTFVGNLNGLRERIRERDGERGLYDLPVRLARVRAKGTSSIEDASADETMWHNRASEDGRPLTRQQIIDHFVRGTVGPQKGHPPCGCESSPSCPNCWTFERFMGRTP